MNVLRIPLTVASALFVVSIAAGQAPTGGRPRAAQESGYIEAGCNREERDINPDCRRESGKAARKTPRETAPIDLTGHWVSMIVEDWRWRMITPPKGDFASLPLNQEAQRVANTWDLNNPQRCKAFGAAGLMRNPMRIHFTWENDTTLKMETDHGMQTRMFPFGPTQLPAGAPSIQGESHAAWDAGGLKVVTTRLAPGYLRKNGVPYSDKTTLTEYYHRYSALGQDYFTVMTVVNDPTYLTREFITTTDFKKLADGADWNPTPCEATQNTTDQRATR